MTLTTHFSTLSRAFRLAATAAALAAACAAPSHATSFTSSASSAGSASSGSISDSIGGSSNSSSGDDRVAAGEYRVIQVAQAPAKVDTTRVTLRAVAAGPAREFFLDVPNRALAERRVNAGELVQVSQRVYGYEFAHADTKRSFFLALQDDWYRDLASRKVTI
jgi:type IV secretory pathway TrbL component